MTFTFMRKLQQTKLNDPLTGRNGNCLATVMACWLDMDILDVPNVETLFDLEERCFYGDVMLKWLNSKGKIQRIADEFRCFHLSNDVERLVFEEKWGKSFIEMQSELEGQFYLVTGMSPRNRDTRHIVIYRDGKLWHDPHPDGTGLHLPEGALESLNFNFYVIE